MRLFATSHLVRGANLPSVTSWPSFQLFIQFFVIFLNSTALIQEGPLSPARILDMETYVRQQ